MAGGVLKRESDMSPEDYFNEIVRPTVSEFAGDPHSRRRGYLAAIVAFQAKDFLAKANVTDIDEKMNRITDSFSVVRAVANGAKHMVADRNVATPFHAGSDFIRPPAECKELEGQASEIGDMVGGVTILYDNRSIYLLDAVEDVVAAFERLWPEHFPEPAWVTESVPA